MILFKGEIIKFHEKNWNVDTKIMYLTNLMFNGTVKL